MRHPQGGRPLVRGAVVARHRGHVVGCRHRVAVLVEDAVGIEVHILPLVVGLAAGVRQADAQPRGRRCGDEAGVSGAVVAEVLVVADVEHRARDPLGRELEPGRGGVRVRGGRHALPAGGEGGFGQALVEGLFQDVADQAVAVGGVHHDGHPDRHFGAGPHLVEGELPGVQGHRPGDRLAVVVVQDDHEGCVVGVRTPLHLFSPFPFP